MQTTRPMFVLRLFIGLIKREMVLITFEDSSTGTQEREINNLLY